MPRYFLTVRYDGTGFHGSQIQGSQTTVQLALNEALSLLLREPVETFGASRTDEGVHALANVYHFDTEKTLSARLLYNLNAMLPHGLATTGIAQPHDPELNARFAATSRLYRYRIYFRKDPFLHKRGYLMPYPAQIALLHETAALLMRHTDFTTFAKRNAQTKTNICQIMESRWEDRGDEWQYVVRANRFLRGMVRALVGTQLQVARGKVSVPEFEALIAAKDNTGADFSVPGCGLYLEEVAYPEGCFLVE